MKKYLAIIITAMTALIPMACYGSTKADNGPKDMKAIVIYFSHAGDNYSVGNIKEGNTKLVADMICEATGADRFEIVAEKSYDMAYTPLINLAKEEQQKGELPEFKDAFSIYGHDVRTSGKKNVEAWLKKLGF